MKRKTIVLAIALCLLSGCFERDTRRDYVVPGPAFGYRHDYVAPRPFYGRPIEHRDFHEEHRDHDDRHRH